MKKTENICKGCGGLVLGVLWKRGVGKLKKIETKKFF